MFDGLYIMSEKTWEALKAEEFEFATTQPDPIQYIMKTLAQLDVEFDENVPFGLYVLIPDED